MFSPEMLKIVLLALVVSAMGIGLLSLMFGGVWHVVYLIKGRPNLAYGEKYFTALFNRGFSTFASIMSAALVFFVLSVVGKEITARLPNAEVVTTRAPYIEGNYTKIQRKDIPEKYRRYVKENDALFMSANVIKGKKYVIRAVEDAKNLPSSFVIVESYNYERLPWKIFRWAGPLYSHKDRVAFGKGNEKFLSGLQRWAIIDS